VILPNRFNSLKRHKISELRAGCLSKIDQEAMRAAMEPVTWAGASKLGRGPAIVRISVLHFQISSGSRAQPNLVVSECV